MLDKLTERLRKLQLENVELVKENAGLKTELLNLRCTQEGGEADANPGDDTEERLSEEAARKRLERICKRKGDGIFSYVGQVIMLFLLDLLHGNRRYITYKKHNTTQLNQSDLPRTLNIPESIHDAWKKGGESRASLQKLLEDAQFNKDIQGHCFRELNLPISSPNILTRKNHNHESWIKTNHTF